jgi:hypothetical protein
MQMKVVGESLRVEPIEFGSCVGLIFINTSSSIRLAPCNSFSSHDLNIYVYYLLPMSFHCLEWRNFIIQKYAYSVCLCLFVCRKFSHGIARKRCPVSQSQRQIQVTTDNNLAYRRDIGCYLPRANYENLKMGI